MISKATVSSGFYEHEFHDTVEEKICDICQHGDDSDCPEWGEIDISYRDKSGIYIEKHLDVCRHCIEKSNLYQKLIS